MKLTDRFRPKADLGCLKKQRIIIRERFRRAIINLSRMFMKDRVDLDEYSQMLRLQMEINERLATEFENNKDKGREHLADYLVEVIPEIMAKINYDERNFHFGSYGGDIHFENSEQSFWSGKKDGCGIILSFVGYSCQVTWEGSDKYG